MSKLTHLTLIPESTPEVSRQAALEKFVRETRTGLILVNQLAFVDLPAVCARDYPPKVAQMILDSMIAKLEELL